VREPPQTVRYDRRRAPPGSRLGGHEDGEQTRARGRPPRRPGRREQAAAGGRRL